MECTQLIFSWLSNYCVMLQVIPHHQYLKGGLSESFSPEVEMAKFGGLSFKLLEAKCKEDLQASLSHRSVGALCTLHVVVGKANPIVALRGF